MTNLESCPFEEPVGNYSIKNKETRLGETLEHDQTNEEWLGSLSTEEKAEAIFAFMDAVNQQNRNGEHITNKEEIIRDVIIKWLKNKTNHCFKCGEGHSCNVLPVHSADALRVSSMGLNNG